jgi:polyphosphate kinase
MPRNLDRRVEVVTPIEEEAHQARLREMLEVLLGDEVSGWELEPDGSWQRLPGGGRIDAQHRLYELAQLRARRGPERG